MGSVVLYSMNFGFKGGGEDYKYNALWQYNLALLVSVIYLRTLFGENLYLEGSTLMFNERRGREDVNIVLSQLFLVQVSLKKKLRLFIKQREISKL